MCLTQGHNTVTPVANPGPLGSEISCIVSVLLKHTVVLSEPIFLTRLSLASLLWDIGKQNSPRCDAAERGVPTGAILFA